MPPDLLDALVPQVIIPLSRISFFIVLGLFVANLIESLNWTHRLSILARPLIRFGNLSSLTGASFSMAFFSGVAANTMLAEAFDQHKMNKKELILANLFNSLPRFFLHLPTVFFLTVPFIKYGALAYVGITFSAAILQTVGVVATGKLLLTSPNQLHTVESSTPAKTSFKDALKKSIKRLKKRIVKILKFLVPIYLLLFLLNWFGVFQQIEHYLATEVWFLSWLKPQAMTIVLLHVTAEFSAGLAAASVLLAENSLSTKEVVMALLVGNILSTPIRALRHQLPYYTGIFPPGLAVQLVGISQLTRAICVILVAVCYYLLT